MEGVSLNNIQQWTAARVVGILDPQRSVAGISTDTRTLAAGELFLALRGPNFDGHEFVDRALARGACGAIVERAWGEAAAGGDAGPLLLVPSPEQALGTIARNYRRRFDLPVIGVVGSAGKTTTKEMIAAVLGRRYQVLKSARTENNEIGIPKTILQLTREHQVAVLEMAARGFGDISYLCWVAQPTIGLLLNIGTAHLGLFESVEGVAKAKGELLDCLDESCLALVNADDCVVCKEVMRTKGRLLAFSLERESQFRGEGLVLDQEGRGHFSLQNIPFDLKIPGRHNVYNALAAAAVGRVSAVPWPDIQQALGSFQAVPMRGEMLRHNGICIINDCYNANPGSVKAALELLDSIESGSGRRIAVLGDMLELGDQAPALHGQIGRQLSDMAIDRLFATGPLSAETVAAARDAGMAAERARHFGDTDALNDHLSTALREGDVVLVKASRGMQLEEVVARLT